MNSAAAVAAAIKPVTLPPDLLEVVQPDGWQPLTMERHLVSPDGVVVPLSGAELRLLCTFAHPPAGLQPGQADGASLRAHDGGVRAQHRPAGIAPAQQARRRSRSPTLLKTVRGVGYVLEVQHVRAIRSGSADQVGGASSWSQLRPQQVRS